MSRNIRTLGDMRAGEADPDSGAESDGENRQQGFFVGGSEHSGQEVLGPPTNRGRPGDDFINQVFDSARRNGAAAMQPSELAEEAKSSKNKGAFSGGGARLGRGGEEAPAPSAAPADEVPREQEETGRPEVVVRLLMWEDGLSIDDGPLRSLEDPETRQFLEHIMQGPCYVVQQSEQRGRDSLCRIPPELIQMHPRSTIDLRMERQAGPYQAPKKVAKPFEGGGARLGNVVPNVLGAGTSQAAPVPTVSKEDSVKLLEDAQKAVNLTEGAQVTQIQLRLSNGTRVIGRFNPSHTLSAVRQFIAQAHPELACSVFHFIAGFPPKPIEDESQTLQDAGLLNSAITVKMTA